MGTNLFKFYTSPFVRIHGSLLEIKITYVFSVNTWPFESETTGRHVKHYGSASRASPIIRIGNDSIFTRLSDRLPGDQSSQLYSAVPDFFVGFSTLLYMDNNTTTPTTPTTLPSPTSPNFSAGPRYTLGPPLHGRQTIAGECWLAGD